MAKSQGSYSLRSGG